MRSYQTNRPINRPVLKDPPWWPVDVQALPPKSWCTLCGAEVYADALCICPRCRVNES